MKVIAFSLSVNMEALPKSPLSFLSKLTIGQLRIPYDFLLEFEAQQLQGSISSDRKLLLPTEMTGVKEDEILVQAEVTKRR